jgi:hypothetical protein
MHPKQNVREAHDALVAIEGFAAGELIFPTLS